MIFECKHYGVDLTKEPASQLYRYFSVTEARLGVLTDGVDISVLTAVPLEPYENGPGTPCAGMMGLSKPTENTGGNQARGPQ